MLQRFKGLPLRLKALVIVLAIVLVGVWGVVGFALGARSANANEKNLLIGALLNESIVPEVADVPNPITGVLYTKKDAAEWENRVPLAVMIENSVDARPHSSLSKADIVYEALAEGSITRFVAVFLTNKTTKDLGPVRSAREYYMYWALEYKAAYAHWGGNEGVRALARSLFGNKDFDQFFIGAPTFFRRPPYGVHSAYTTTAGLWNVAKERSENKKVSIDIWKFKSDSPAKKPTAKNITVNFLGDPGYVVVWKYDSKTNSYKRYNGGYAHMDKVYNKQISVKNVIVQYVVSKGYKIVTGVANRNFETIGSGKVLIFRDGKVASGTWKKKSKSSRTRFFDKKGKEIPLNRGQSWVDVVPSDSAVSYK